MIGVEPLEGVAQLGDEIAVEEIVRRAAHLYGRDRAVSADPDLLKVTIVIHLPAPLLRLMTA